MLKEFEPNSLPVSTASLAPDNNSPTFKNAKDLYDMVDATPIGEIPWQSFSLKYTRPKPKTLGPDGAQRPVIKLMSLANIWLWQYKKSVTSN